MKRPTRQKPTGSFFRRFIQSRLTLVVSFVLMVVIGVSLVREINNRRALTRERQSLENEVAALEGRNSELSQLIERLQGTEFAEEEARLKLGLKKPGEKVVRIIGQGAGANGQSAAAGGSQDESTSVPLHWWNYFFNH